MTQKFVDRIVESAYYGKHVYNGRYAYSTQFHPMTGAEYIIRCRRDLVGKEYITHNGEQCSYWRFMEPVIMEGRK